MINSDFNYFVDPDRKCLFNRAYGVLTFALAKEMALQSRSDGKYQNNFDSVTELTDVELKMTSNELRKLADYIASNWPTKTPINACIIVNSQLAHGLIRMYGSYVEGRSSSPLIIKSDTPDLQTKIKTYMDLPEQYDFPEFLSFSSR